MAFDVSKTSMCMHFFLTEHVHALSWEEERYYNREELKASEYMIGITHFKGAHAASRAQGNKIWFGCFCCCTLSRPDMHAEYGSNGLAV